MKTFDLFVLSTALFFGASQFATADCKPIKNSDGTVDAELFNPRGESIHSEKLQLTNDARYKGAMSVPSDVIRQMGGNAKMKVNGKRIRLSVNFTTQKRNGVMVWIGTNSAGRPISNIGGCVSSVAEFVQYDRSKLTTRNQPAQSFLGSNVTFPSATLYTTLD